MAGQRRSCEDQGKHGHRVRFVPAASLFDSLEMHPGEPVWCVRSSRPLPGPRTPWHPHRRRTHMLVM